MDISHLTDWLKLAAALPPLVAVWKLPVAWNWIKMRFAAAAANAVVDHLGPMIEKMQGDIASVRYQVFPNGGGSMSDQINRIHDTAKSTERAVLVLRDTMRAHQDADASQARFEADADGRMTWAAAALQRWCAKAPEQVHGYGWVNCVAHDDREGVREEWGTALREQREMNLRFNMIDDAGVLFPVEMLAKPLRIDDRIQSWVGTITKAG